MVPGVSGGAWCVFLLYSNENHSTEPGAITTGISTLQSRERAMVVGAAPDRETDAAVSRPL